MSEFMGEKITVALWSFSKQAVIFACNVGIEITSGDKLSLFNNSVFYHENWLYHIPFAVQYWCSIFRMSTKALKYKGDSSIALFFEERET